jgi:hypothetical protein
MIRKETYLNDNCLTELRRIIESSEILKEDDQVSPIVSLISHVSLVESSFGLSPTKLAARCLF